MPPGIVARADGLDMILPTVEESLRMTGEVSLFPAFLNGTNERQTIWGAEGGSE